MHCPWRFPAPTASTPSGHVPHWRWLGLAVHFDLDQRIRLGKLLEKVLLGYARRILKLHSEVFNTLREPHMVGLVRIGTPDDYVMRFLALIATEYPQVWGHQAFHADRSGKA